MKTALFTMVKDEAFFLPRWYGYYNRFFPDKDIYILDNQSTDGCAEPFKNKCNVSLVEHETAFDHEWMRLTISKFQNELLDNGYTSTLFCDVDEFIFHNMFNRVSLGDYIEAFEKSKDKLIACTGMEIIHLPGVEPKFDHSKKILEQRRFVYDNRSFNKPYLSKIKIEYGQGHHTCKPDVEGVQDLDLLLLHCKKYDYDECKKKQLERSQYNWNEYDFHERLGWQNRATGEEFERYYYSTGMFIIKADYGGGGVF